MLSLLPAQGLRIEEVVPAEAYRYCEWITSHHYENFPVASWLLPTAKRRFVSAMCAFARAADDFAYEEKYQGRSLELLNGWKRALWACASDPDHPEQGRLPFDGLRANGRVEGHPIFIALADAIRRCRLPPQLLEDLLTAFTMDVTKRRYADWEELLTYCRYSANPVGRLVLAVFGRPEPALHELSDRICTGLQLTNHWQDLSLDLPRKDRLYIPLDLMARHGVTEADLKSFRPGTSYPQRDLTPFKGLMAELVERTRAIFDAGEPLLDRVSGRLRLELKLTLLGGRAILDRIAAADYDVFSRRPVLSGRAKLNLLARALFR